MIKIIYILNMRVLHFISNRNIKNVKIKLTH